MKEFWPRRRRALLVGAIVLLIAAFIWNNSLQDAGASARRSFLFDQMAAGLLNFLGDGVSWQQLDHLVRKTAHFIEFCLLGAFLRLFFSCVREASWTALRLTLAPLLLAAAAASIDELIQRFEPGRTSQFQDVLLDSAGALAGILLTGCLLRYVRSRRRSDDHHRKEESI